MKIGRLFNLAATTVIIWMLINLIGFGFAWFTEQPAQREHWQVMYKWGTFYIDGVPKGFEFGNTITYLLLIGIFLILLVSVPSRSRLKSTPNDKKQ